MQELIITKSPLLGGNNAFDGHVYELIEYAYILRSKYDVSIYITSDLKERLVNAIDCKYTFTADESDALVESIVTYTDVIDAPDAIFLNVDGYLDWYIDNGVDINVKKVVTFRCFATTINTVDEFCKQHHVTLLSDKRIYTDTFENVTVVDYVKKVLLDKIIKPTSDSKKLLLYFNNVCKRFDMLHLIKYKGYGELFVIGPSELSYLSNLKFIEFGEIPVDNLFDRFGTYVYTGTSQGTLKEDCSCRFLCECAYFDKEIIVDCSYELDLATKIRLSDCKTNIEQLLLTVDDDLFNLL